MPYFKDDFPTLEEQAVVKLACEQSLKVFMKVMHYYVNNCKFTFLDFHNEVIQALEDRVFQRTTKNLMINMPVGFGKSSIVQGFIPWGFARNKNLTFLYTSYSDNLIQKHSSEIKDLMNSDLYNRLWGYEFEKDKKSKANWSIKGSIKRSGLTAGAMGGTITGLDAGNPAVEGFCGAMIIDDPMKATDSIFDKAREDVVYKYQTGLKTRLRRADVPTILIMQRLHEEDLAGWILEHEPESWDVVKVQALVDEKSIWPEKVATETLIKEREKAPWVFYAQRQQEPNSNINTQFKGLQFEEDEKKIFDGIGHVDKSFGGEDATAFTIANKVAVFDENKKHTHDEYIIFGKKWNKHIDECISEINALKAMFKCGTVYTENNDDKGYTAKNNKGYATYHESMNKHYKIMTYLYTNWKNVKFIDGTDFEYIKEIQNYQEKAKHDDCPDSASSVIRLLEGSGLKTVSGIMV